MRANRPLRMFAQPVIAAGVLFAATLPAWEADDRTAEQQGGITIIEKAEPVKASFARAPVMPQKAEPDVRNVAETFVWGLANDRADVVWQYATEEEQAGLGTEGAVLTAFKEAYPPLAHAQDITFNGIQYEGEVPFVSFYVKDGLGLQWLATFGIEYDDAGDWRVVSLDIKGAPGELI